MTNASIKNSLFVLSVIAATAALSLGAFAMTAHADSFSDYGDYGGGGWSDYGGYNSGFSDYGSYTPDYSNYGDYSGWSDYGNGYVDVSAPQYTDVSAPQYTDVSAPQYTDVSAPQYSYDTYGVYDTYDTYQTTDTYDTSAQSYQQAMSFVPPTVRQYVPPQPVVIPQPQRPVVISQPQQQQQQQQQQSGGQPININNVNTNTNTNTNVAPVSQAQPQPIVQYVYPQQPVYQPTYQPQPYCTITATTGQGGLVTLSWSSTNATTAYISPSIGSVAPYGTTNLYAYGNSVYTMTVSGQGGTNTCTTRVNTPVAPYVSLSQIPYTGFDFGPVGNAIYWAALLSFAVAGAYLIVYFRGGAAALVSSTFGSRKTVVAPTPVVASVPVAPAPVTKTAEQIFDSLPAMPERTTRDSMQIARSTGGMPRIVIARA